MLYVHGVIIILDDAIEKRDPYNIYIILTNYIFRTTIINYYSHQFMNYNII